MPTQLSKSRKPQNPGESNGENIKDEYYGGASWVRSKFLPVLWTTASVLSLSLNIILIAILFFSFQTFETIKSSAIDQASSLIGGLYMNFSKMDQSRIQTNIRVETFIPVKFLLNASGSTKVILSEPVSVDGALITTQTGGLNITNAPSTITLPQGTVLPVNFEGLVIPVDINLPISLNVPVEVPINETELHDPLVGLQEVLRPWYCLVEPNALSLNGLSICQ